MHQEGDALMADLPDFDAVIHGDPERALRIIMDDLCKRLRSQGVKDHSIEGVKIAMGIAYRVGERAGLNAMITGMASPPAAPSDEE
jgi:hypothetical protein